MGFYAIYEQLRQHFGPKDWWPADTAFEVMVGAILTQNTAWTNVEKAIRNLRSADSLDPQIICALPHEKLARLIRPSGYYNIKTRRLQAWCNWYLEYGGYEALDKLPTPELRAEVLSVYGIGPETADDIVLYAFNRPVFVIDAYTRRIFSRLGLIAGDESYDDLSALFEQELPTNTALFNEYHALIVNQAKHICQKKPRCEQCPLAPDCLFFTGRH